MAAHKSPNNHLSVVLAFSPPPFPTIFLYSVSSAFILPSFSLHKSCVCVCLCARTCHSMCLRVGVWLAWLDYGPTVSHWQSPRSAPSAHRTAPSFPPSSAVLKGTFTQMLKTKIFFYPRVFQSYGESGFMFQGLYLLSSSGPVQWNIVSVAHPLFCPRLKYL